MIAVGFATVRVMCDTIWKSEVSVRKVKMFCRKRMFNFATFRLRFILQQCDARKLLTMLHDNKCMCRSLLVCAN